LATLHYLTIKMLTRTQCVCGADQGCRCKHDAAQEEEALPYVTNAVAKKRC
jgi:hypothetical protein